MRSSLRGSLLLVITLTWVSSATSRAAEVTLDILDPDGQPLADAVVALESHQKTVFTSPLEYTMNQRGVRFVPRVLAVRTNSLVYFLNSDPIFHHVYSFSPAKRFELGLNKGEQSAPVRFDKPGKVVLGCNIHDAMLAYIYVLDTEWFGVTGSNGRVKLVQIPPGEYDLVVRHPGLATPAREPLVLAPEDQINRRFVLPELAAEPRLPHAEQAH